MKYARVVELVDSLDSGSSAHSGRGGSTPPSRTTKKKPDALASGFFFSEVCLVAREVHFVCEVMLRIVKCLRSWVANFTSVPEPEKTKNAKKVVDKWDLVWYYLGVVRTQLLRNEICASGGIGRLARFRF